MPFAVRDEQSLRDLQPGMQVDFSLAVESDDSYAKDIRIHRYQSMEQEPLRTRRLQLMEEALRGETPVRPLAPGQAVPDFALTDQSGRRLALSHLRGKTVALNFIYTSCPLPNYCFRLSNNFARLQKRFANRLGKDLVLLTITFDPVHDRPEILAKYATAWKADPNSWHFLTGSLAEIQAVCRPYGVTAWAGEGAVTHSLHTVIIDRQGKLAANLEGNEFSAEQLGDLVESTLSH